MSIQIRLLESTESQKWDTYVDAHPHATLYHLAGWKKIIETSYDHTAYYLVANKSSVLTTHGTKQPEFKTQSLSHKLSTIDSESVCGIFPLVYLKHLFFDNSLISLPFFDLGGILAEDEDTEIALLHKAIKLAKELGAKNIELRNIEPLSWTNDNSKLPGELANRLFAAGEANSSEKNVNTNLITTENPVNRIFWTIRSSKVRMLLDLPNSSEELMKSFKSKLRSQIKKPIKEGLTSEVGGQELLDDFYKVFSINMRDLGSPVHSKKLIQNVLKELLNDVRLVLIYKEQEPVAGSVIVGFKDTLENPWASSLREYSKLSPNMLLYWTMLEYGCNNGFRYFDFGRSTPGEGTYKFKEQWGAKPEPLNWINISLKGEKVKTSISEDSKFQLASEVWKKLPVTVANLIGPRIRKYISL